ETTAPVELRGPPKGMVAAKSRTEIHTASMRLAATRIQKPAGRSTPAGWACITGAVAAAPAPPAGGAGGRGNGTSARAIGGGVGASAERRPAAPSGRPPASGGGPDVSKTWSAMGGRISAPLVASGSRACGAAGGGGGAAGAAGTAARLSTGTGGGPGGATSGGGTEGGGGS